MELYTGFLNKKLSLKNSTEKRIKYFIKDNTFMTFAKK